MKKLLIIEADTNDGDIVTSINEVTDEQIETIKPVIEAIKNFVPYKVDIYTHHHNYPSGDICREDLGEKHVDELYGHLGGFEDFDELCPYNEFGIHTICSVKVLEVTKEEELFKFY